MSNPNTGVNKVEQIKLERDGLDVIRNLERYAQQGFGSIEPSDFDRLKWYGLYVQRPKAEGNFLLRVKLPGGRLNSSQASILAKLARKYGRNQIDITTRQAVQFHWIKIENLPDIFHQLSEVGLSSVEAAGDCPRNIVCSPLAGIDPDEVIDPQPLVIELNQFFEGNRDFSNLPRKFKIGITGSSYESVQVAIQDVSFVPAVKKIEGQRVMGFHVLVGGGLSAAPRLASRLNLFLLPKQVLLVAVGVATLFRDYGYREKRQHARLKFLVEDWGIEKFTTELLNLTGPLQEKGFEETITSRSLIGVHQQKQAGLCYVGMLIPAGRLSGQELETIARLAEVYGDGSLRTTVSQNIILPNVPDHKISRLLKEILIQRYIPKASLWETSVSACTGKRYCPFAAAHTREHVADILEELKKSTSVSGRVNIHISGCMNSCGQHQIADIGLQGARLKQDGRLSEGFELWIGGAAGVSGAFAVKLGGTIPATEVSRVTRMLLEYVNKQKIGSESFHDAVQRLGFQDLQCRLDEIIQLERDNERSA